METLLRGISLIIFDEDNFVLKTAVLCLVNGRPVSLNHDNINLSANHLISLFLPKNEGVNCI